MTIRGGLARRSARRRLNQSRHRTTRRRPVNLSASQSTPPAVNSRAGPALGCGLAGHPWIATGREAVAPFPCASESPMKPADRERGWSRREVLRVGGASLLGLSLVDLLAGRARAQSAAAASPD